MKEVVITTGVYGGRDKKGRLLPVAKGERVTLSDEEAARLVALEVALYTDEPTQAPNTTPAPPEGEEGQVVPQDTPDAGPAADGEEDDFTDAEAARLERMQRPDLEQMAADLGVGVAAITGARNKRTLIELILAAGETDGEEPPELSAGDIVQ